MPAYNFDFIGAPPADDLVNEQSQLNGNLDQIENRYNFLQNIPGGTFPDVDKPKGLEQFRTVSAALRTAVWTGSIWRAPTSAQSSWSAWSNIGLVAPYNDAWAGFTPRWRNNTALRLVQVRGRIRNTVTGVPMNKAAWTNFSPDGTGIPLGFAPSPTSVWTTSASPIDGASPVGSEINGVRLRARLGATTTILDFNWMGQDSGATGNYFSIDGWEWWY